MYVPYEVREEAENLKNSGSVLYPSEPLAAVNTCLGNLSDHSPFNNAATNPFFLLGGINPVLLFFTEIFLDRIYIFLNLIYIKLFAEIARSQASSRHPVGHILQRLIDISQIAVQKGNFRRLQHAVSLCSLDDPFMQ